MENREDYLSSPVQEELGSYNSTYISSAVGTKYELKCPHGMVKTPQTAQFLTCLPNREIALDPPGERKCAG